jgi:hypothetical protein
MLMVGAWALEVAEERPDAQILGMDLSPVQPNVVPQNCEFIVGDLTEGLDGQFDPGSFDLVHSRYVTRQRTNVDLVWLLPESKENSGLVIFTTSLPFSSLELGGPSSVS